MSVAPDAFEFGFYFWLKSRARGKQLTQSHAETFEFLEEQMEWREFGKEAHDRLISPDTSQEVIKQMFLEYGADYGVMDGLEKLLPIWQHEVYQWQQRSAEKVVRRAIPLSLRFDILERDGFRCRYCGQGASEGAKLEIDHIKPVAKGGLTVKANLQTTCFEYNRGKRDRIVN